MRYFQQFFLFLLGFFLLSAPLLAAPNIGTEQGGMTRDIGDKIGFNTNVDDTSLSQTVGRVIRVALAFVGTIFLALTVYAGFLWMTAAGNSEQVDKAMEILKMAIIGLIIVVAAYSITYFALFYIRWSAGPQIGPVGGVE